MWIHSLLAISQLLGLPIVYRAWPKRDAYLVAAMLFFGILAHACEERDGLGARFGEQTYRATRHLDLSVTWVVFLYFGGRMWLRMSRSIGYWRKTVKPKVCPAFLIGLFAFALGEFRADVALWNLIVYPSAHLLWHLSFFYCLWHLL